ncbi:unnamed protein product [Didymodactylos carnosus]|uniref:protein-tyrosine-phosphatase n=1 Tax=Didymodactylos carnosus TaxID=1234261 RepID=A0A815AKI9_9BILA|nr:unnamed protein product [Didymodactylos carnosus]CAF4031568.1 unnamed protein product [Didymodactylos carnosus]
MASRPLKFDCSELIKDFLYLGSAPTSKNINGLKTLNITHIVNLAGKCHFPSDFIYGEFHIPDRSESTEKFDEHLEPLLKFIDEARTTPGHNSRVLVHCQGGISRTPTIAIIYLMHSLHMTLNDAFQLVQEKRPNMRPNTDHLKKLLKVEQSMFGKNSISEEALQTFLVNKTRKT